MLTISWFSKKQIWNETVLNPLLVTTILYWVVYQKKGKRDLKKLSKQLCFQCTRNSLGIKIKITLFDFALSMKVLQLEPSW